MAQQKSGQLVRCVHTLNLNLASQLVAQSENPIADIVLGYTWIG